MHRDARAPVGTAWQLAGATAVGLLAVILAANALVDARRLAALWAVAVRGFLLADAWGEGAWRAG